MAPQPPAPPAPPPPSCDEVNYRAGALRAQLINIFFCKISLTIQLLMATSDFFKCCPTPLKNEKILYVFIVCIRAF